MSYDIELIDPVTKEPVELDEPHHMRGGTYAMGGTARAHLNVTYNYGAIFRRVLGDEGIRTIYGKSGAESIQLLDGAAAPELLEALQKLVAHDDYLIEMGLLKHCMELDRARAAIAKALGDPHGAT